MPFRAVVKFQLVSELPERLAVMGFYTHAPEFHYIAAAGFFFLVRNKYSLVRCCCQHVHCILRATNSELDNSNFCRGLNKIAMFKNAWPVNIPLSLSVVEIDPAMRIVSLM